MPAKKSAKSAKAKSPSKKRAAAPRTRIMWINHFDLLPGDPSVLTSFNAISSAVGGGLTGLVIQSITTGDTAAGGGNKVVHMGLEVPPGFLIKGFSYTPMLRMDAVPTQCLASLRSPIKTSRFSASVSYGEFIRCLRA